MAEQQASTISSAFPPPPPFYVHFTPDNITALAFLRASQESLSYSEPSQEQAEQHIFLPNGSPLRFLQPPQPPTDGKWRTFGEVFDVNHHLPSLPEQGIEQLYPSSAKSNTDRALVLKRLAKSLLLNFLELMGIMSQSPTEYKDKIDDMSTLFVNFHHLCNEYRPHQAREQLIELLEEQVRRVREEREGVERMRDKVQGLMRELSDKKIPEQNDDEIADERATERKKKEEYRKMVWEELINEFGDPEAVDTYVPADRHPVDGVTDVEETNAY